MTALITALAALALLAGCGRGENEPVAADTEASAAAVERVTIAAEAIATTGVEVTPAAVHAIGSELRVTAVIRPNENRLAHVSPPIPGRAIEVKAVLGSVVRAGQPLALLDSLELGEKKSAFLQSRTNLEVARRNADREARLFRQRISSEKEYLEAKGEFERSDAAFKAAREVLHLVGLTDADLQHVTWGGSDHPLSHFPIIAPFGGTVIEQHITLGELVTPADKPYAIADLGTLWILLDIYEKDIARVTAGTPAQVQVDAYPTEHFPGRITYVSNVLDEQTRTAQARVELGNADGRLRPGMFATAEIQRPTAEQRAVVVVPENAVQRVHERSVVFVEEAPGTYLARTVTLGARMVGQVEITAGVTAGEPVVTAGGFTLKSVLLQDELAGDD